MKKLIAVLALLALPVVAQAQGQMISPVYGEDSRLAVNTSIMSICRGPNKGQLWADAGVSYRIYSWGNEEPTAKIAILTRFLKIEDQDPTSVGFSMLWIEPVTAIPGVDIIFELGGGNKLAVGGGDKKEWGRIVGAALNYHIAKHSSIFAGAKIFDATPGQINSAGWGFGAVIYADDFLGSLWPGKK